METENKYLIIGGSTKCGTTSVFSYFQFHPMVCPCQMKESRYFLEKDYFVMAAGRNHDKAKSFDDLFAGCEYGQVRLEATPDYLYSEHAAIEIYRHLPGARLVFILRDPVDRLISWYKFATLNGMIETGLSLASFVQLQQKESVNATPQHLRALEQGKYSKYLQRYIELFGSDRIHVCFYETLNHRPSELCAGIAKFAGIDPDYFINYQFLIYNKSVPVKSVRLHQLFRKLKRSVRPATRLLPSGLREKLKFAGHHLENAYSSANQSGLNPDVSLDKETLQFLSHYYANETAEIIRLTGQRPPWKYLSEQ